MYVESEIFCFHYNDDYHIFCHMRLKNIHSNTFSLFSVEEFLNAHEVILKLKSTEFHKEH